MITGGSSGLGALLAEVYGMRGVGVAVLDIKGKEEELEEKGVKLYKCDVGDRAQVEGAARAIEQDVRIISIMNAILPGGLHAIIPLLCHP